MKNKLNHIKELNQNVITIISQHLFELNKITTEKQAEVLNQLTEIQTLLDQFKIEKPDHGPKPLYGYMDKDEKIPYVKTELVLNYLAHKTGINKHTLKQHHIWKFFKLWLKNNFNLKHVWKSPTKIDGVMVIYENITVEEIIEIVNVFLTENNFNKDTTF